MKRWIVWVILLVLIVGIGLGSCAHPPENVDIDTGVHKPYVWYDTAHDVGCYMYMGNIDCVLLSK